MSNTENILFTGLTITKSNAKQIGYKINEIQILIKISIQTFLYTTTDKYQYKKVVEDRIL